MYPIDPAGRGRRTIRRSLPAPLLPLGLLLFLVLGTLAASPTVFPFFPVLIVVLFFAIRRRLGQVATWYGGLLAVGMSTDDSPALPPNKISKEKELLEALERHGEITVARAALETSLSVAEAEEMLSGLASNGHVRVSTTDGRLAYALWD